MSANWDQIKAEYLAGGTTFRKLSEKHGVSFNVLSKRAKKENWTKARRKASEKKTQKIAEKIANKQAKSSVDALDVARYTAQRWQDVLNDMAEIVSKNKSTYAVDMSQVRALSGAIKDNIDNLYRTCRLISAMDERRLALEERRLALEEAKWKADQETRQNGAESMVITMDLPEGVDV